MSNREELHLLTGAYALDALDGDEKEAFEVHLERSEQARTEVASLIDTAVMLGLATAPEAPPADLKARLMAQVAGTPQLDAEPVAADLAAEGRYETRMSRAETKAQARWYTRPATILVAAAAALALVTTGVAVGLNSSQSTQQAETGSIAELSAAGDLQRATAEVAGGGAATLIWSLELRRSAVLIDDLPQLPGDKTYELWYIDDSGAASAGTFNAAESGKTVKVLDGTMSGGETVGITVEPKGGSKQPTTKPILVIDSA